MPSEIDRLHLPWWFGWCYSRFCDTLIVFCCRPLYGELCEAQSSWFPQGVFQHVCEPPGQWSVCRLHTLWCTAHEETCSHPAWKTGWLCAGKGLVKWKARNSITECFIILSLHSSSWLFSFVLFSMKSFGLASMATKCMVVTFKKHPAVVD